MAFFVMLVIVIGVPTGLLGLFLWGRPDREVFVGNGVGWLLLVMLCCSALQSIGVDPLFPGLVIGTLLHTAIKLRVVTLDHQRETALVRALGIDVMHRAGIGARYAEDVGIFAAIAPDAPCLHFEGRAKGSIIRIYHHNMRGWKPEWVHPGGVSDSACWTDWDGLEKSLRLEIEPNREVVQAGA